MKKIISLILMVMIVCSAISGCFLDNIIKQPLSTTINPEYEGIVWEEKRYWQGDVSANFVPGELLVVMDQALSGYNKAPDPEFFVGVEVIKVIDIAPPLSPEDVKPGFHQFLKLILSEKYNTKEATLEAMHILEPIVGIRSVEPNGILELLLAPNDPYYSFADGVSDQWAIDKINAPLVWDFTIGSELINVGVIDTGTASHYDLNDNYDTADAWTFYDSDDLSPTQYLKTDSNYHGTHVAGIIGAVGNDMAIVIMNLNFL